MDQRTLKDNFAYCQDTGEFLRINRKGSNGSIDRYGYLILKIKGKQYKAHRMAWLYVYGEVPSGNIDHINRVRSDNRISNLRCISQADNCRNMTVSKNNETGYKGVHLDSTKGLKARYATKVNGKTFRFYSAKEASEYRLKKLKDKGFGDGHFD